MTILAVLGRFCHGLVFFTLSLTIRFLHYRSRRILLARHLVWLGMFATCEAVYAWTTLFVSLVPGAGSLPPFVRPVILGVGYTYLLAFGLQTMMSEETYTRRFRSWLTGIVLAWVVPYAIAVVSLWPHWTGLAPTAETLMRITLALPGSLLTAIGLRRQSYQSLDSSLRLRIRPYLHVVEISMGIFALLNIVIVLRPLTFLARHLNVSALNEGLAGWVWALVGAAMTYGIVQSLTTVQREIEQWVEGIERLQALADDRERIGRELHDGIIQSIYAASLLLESIQAVLPRDPERAQAQIGRVIDNLNSTIQDIRRYIFDLRSDIADDDLQTGIERLLRDFHINTLLETELEVTGEPRPIHSITRRRHIFQVAREALTNTAKHARAQCVSVQLTYGEDALDLTISDDGIGMEQLLISKGYGLRNIRERARLLEGTLRIESAPDAGVTYHLSVPYT
ncbi:MAG: sensor histidine kinase [Anaerolineae bacterium]|nr:sensor histidine kinase [Anaerolineae bacterium]